MDKQREAALLAAFRRMSEMQKKIAVSSFEKIAPPAQQKALPQLKLVGGGRR
jgi:hypothetical protein